MKKIISGFLIAVIILVTNVFAADLGIHTPSSRVAVTGSLDEAMAGESLSLLLVNSEANIENVSESDIGYIDQTVVDSFGNYSFKFMFDGFEFDEYGNISNYTISLKHGDEDITTTVNQAVAVSELTKSSISVRPLGSTVVADYSIDNLYKLANLSYSIILACYNENNELVNVDIETNVVDADKTISELTCTLNEETSYVKAYIWESLSSQIPLTGVESFFKGNIDSCLVTYPTYTTKAVTFNFDDGLIEYDQILVDLFREKGVNAAFNLIGWSSGNCPEYEGFEIANHTTHIAMYNIDENKGRVFTYNECVESIANGKRAIASYIGEENVTGLVWPYCAPSNREDYEQLLDYLRENGYLYARDSVTNGRFDIPEDWMNWKCSATTSNALTRAQVFAAQPFTDDLQMLSIWGHSFDLEAEAMQELYNNIINLVINEEIWNPTPSEFVKYVEAAKRIEYTESYIYNPTNIAIYAIVNGIETVIQPNSYADI